MKIDFSAELRLPEEETAKTIFQALEIEMRGISSHRSNENLEIRGNQLVFRCQAPDITAALASINTFFNWFSTLERLLDII
ncbi:MAG: KEOPS complex subunit Pcc1 [Candidatus Hodarchaeales archaeon]|jgi:tRNA threonylcarbamoyladenosine modification (KEOPS) complex  Pcc1 subunit